MSALYTIGHSTHDLESFLGLLRSHQISAIADVRSAPYSRHNPQFNRETLRQVLKQHGIAYVFLGEELGARSDNPACYEGNKVHYDRLASEPLFRSGLSRVREGMLAYRVGLMCAEREPMDCHRTILVCRHLKEPGTDILHIHADGTVERHEDLECRLMKRHGIVPDLLRTEEECVGLAYQAQGERIAYQRDEDQSYAEATA